MAEKEEGKMKKENNSNTNEAEVKEAPHAEQAKPLDEESIVLDQIKRVSEDDDAPIGTLTLKKILGGDILSAQTVRSQVWLILLIVLFITFYVAIRYQCQQDTIDIVKKEQRLIDAKYKALSSSSSLTERSRESHILNALKHSADSLMEVSKQPPYKIYVPEEQ